MTYEPPVSFLLPVQLESCETEPNDLLVDKRE